MFSFFHRKRQAKVQKELEDAAKEVKNLVDEGLDDSSLVLASEGSPSVPSACGGLDYCLVPKTAAFIFVSFRFVYRKSYNFTVILLVNWFCVVIIRTARKQNFTQFVGVLMGKTLLRVVSMIQM